MPAPVSWAASTIASIRASRNAPVIVRPRSDPAGRSSSVWAAALADVDPAVVADRHDADPDDLDEIGEIAPRAVELQRRGVRLGQQPADPRRRLVAGEALLGEAADLIERPSSRGRDRDRDGQQDGHRDEEDDDRAIHGPSMAYPARVRAHVPACLYPVARATASDPARRALLRPVRRGRRERRRRRAAPRGDAPLLGRDRAARRRDPRRRAPRRRDQPHASGTSSRRPSSRPSTARTCTR